MAEELFVDRAQIYVTAGNGGHGGMSFRREKYVPNGGPDGGNGGRGGSVILKADPGLRTLLAFKYRKKYKAESGGNGTGGRSTGKSGDDLIIRVPIGTIVRDKDTNRIVADLSKVGDTYQAAKGGRGGLGNMNFSTATRQAPRFAQGGEKGQARTLVLELKLLADVGLLGFPNVGKSTFLSMVTAAKPKIANYHFTTIVPNLGVVEWKGYDPFVIADIPGIIEGAHEGTGLGIQFLRHVERTRLLIHVLDASGCEGRDPIDDFKAINAELKEYNERLADRMQVVALNKTDLMDAASVKILCERFEEMGYEVFPMSAATGKGIDALLSRVIQLLDEIGEVQPIFDIEAEEETVYRANFDEPDFTIHKETSRDGDVYVVDGDFERLINSVNFEDFDSIGYFQRKLTERGVFAKLEEMGIQDEDLVRLQDIEFEYFK